MPTALARPAITWLALGAVWLGGCARHPERVAREPAVLLPLQLFADTGRSAPLAVPSPERARAWLQRVSLDAPRREPAAVTPAKPGPLHLPLPQANPDSPPAPIETPDALVVDEGLRPPIPKGATPIHLPRPRRKVILVDLDVRVGESGEVSDALWAGGSADSAAVAAATACALAQRFHPALQRGRPVAVWCRQRFEFGRQGARPAPGHEEAPAAGEPPEEGAASADTAAER